MIIVINFKLEDVYLLGDKINGRVFSLCFILGLLLNHEGGGNIFLLKVGLLSADYVELYSRGKNCL